MILAAALKWLAGAWPRLALYAAIALCAGLFLRGIYNAGARTERLACETEKQHLAAATLQSWGGRIEAGAQVEQAAQVRADVREPRLQTIEREVIRYVERHRTPAPDAPAPHAGTAGGFAGNGLQPPPESEPGDPGDRGQCALDADGLRLWSAAGRGELPGAAGLADPALQPAARGAGLRPPGAPARQPRAMDERAAPLPRPPLGLDRLDPRDPPAAALIYFLQP